MAALARPCWNREMIYVWHDLDKTTPSARRKLKINIWQWHISAETQIRVFGILSLFFFFFFFSWGRKKMTLELHSFKIQISQVQSSTGSCWVQRIFPTITTTVPFGRRRFGFPSCRITSLEMSYLIQLLVKSRGIFLPVSVGLDWALSTFSRSFHCINNVGFAIVLIFYLLCCQIFQIEEFPQLLLKSVGFTGGAKLQFQHPICTLPFAAAIKICWETGLWQFCAGRYA